MENIQICIFVTKLINMKSLQFLVRFSLLLFYVLAITEVNARSSLRSVQTDTIKPGEIWPDQNGNHIQAHGGGIIKI
jgi:hypothetical protein